MSQPQTEEIVPPDHTDREVALREAGITHSANGSYNLPPVLVQYRDGIYQTLVIEVCNRERPSTITTLWNLAQQNAQQDQTNRNQSVDRPSVPETASDIQQETSSPTTTLREESATEHENENGNENGNGNGNGNETPERQMATIFQNAAALSRLGLFRRGISNVPENEGENNDRLLTSRIVDPLQRFFERMSGHTATRTNIDPSDIPPQPPSQNAQEGTSTQTQAQPQSVRDNANAENNSNNTNQTETPSNNDIELRMPGDSRNIILTVNYIQGGQGNENGSGSLLLYVPSIVDTDESNVQLLVRLATEIALRTISTLLQKSAGVSDKVFESLKVKKLADLKPSEQECPICYDSYVEKEMLPELQKKRGKNSELGDDVDDDNTHPNKKLKSNTQQPIPMNNTTSNPVKNIDRSSKGTKVEYTHYPVTLSCEHTFGASCLHEWFKTNSTCPLCREKLPSNSEAINTPQDIQITLPNLARIIGIARTLIDNLNSREMVFHFREDDQVTIDRILQEGDSNILSPAAYQTLLETFTSLRALPNHLNQNENTVTPAGSRTASAPPPSRPATSATSILNFVREVISSMRRDNNVANDDSTRGGSFGVESRRTANGVETRDYTMFGQDRASDNGGESNTNESSSNNSHDTNNA